MSLVGEKNKNKNHCIEKKQWEKICQNVNNSYLCDVR